MFLLFWLDFIRENKRSKFRLDTEKYRIVILATPFKQITNQCYVNAVFFYSFYYFFIQYAVNAVYATFEPVEWNKMFHSVANCAKIDSTLVRCYRSHSHVGHWFIWIWNLKIGVFAKHLPSRPTTTIICKEWWISINLPTRFFLSLSLLTLFVRWHFWLIFSPLRCLSLIINCPKWKVVGERTLVA